MKPRLFWTMLLAFVLVIVLGVCGMLGFFGLALAGIWQPASLRESEVTLQEGYAEPLADYYVANGNSWEGVERRLDAAPFGAPIGAGYTVLDRDGRVVASNDRSFPVGRMVEQRLFERGVPVEAGGEQVGTVVLHPGRAPGFVTGERRGSAMFWAVARSFLVAALGLVSVLMLLAVVLARWLSRPLRRMTSAARSLANGQLDVQVASARVRELDDLASAFNTMARSLSEADRQRRQMTADIAHELRTPLTIIKGRLEGLQDGVYDATPEEIGRLLHETALLERLIEDLRLLALAEAGQLPLFPEQIDLADLLGRAAAAFASDARAQRIALLVEAPDDLPPLELDRQRMAQVLTNLIANALRYTPAGGSVALAATALDDRSAVRIDVRDSGQGIAPEDLPYVFDRFYRADRSRGRASGGAGLGLAIVKQIVGAHGGQVAASSTPGHGTTISLTLPAATAR